MKSLGKVYIAAPFFTQEQLDLVREIEVALLEYGIEFFSPRSEGVIIDMTPEEKAERMNEIFKKNIDEMRDSQTLLAFIDGRDTGTIFEIGYFHAMKELWYFPCRDIVTITNMGHGINIMLRNSTDAHLYGIQDLRKLLATVRATRDTDCSLQLFQCKEERVS